MEKFSTWRKLTTVNIKLHQQRRSSHAWEVNQRNVEIRINHGAQCAEETSATNAIKGHFAQCCWHKDKHAKGNATTYRPEDIISKYEWDLEASYSMFETIEEDQEKEDQQEISLTATTKSSAINYEKVWIMEDAPTI